MRDLSSSEAVSSARAPLLHVPAEVTGQEISSSGVERLHASDVDGSGVSIAVIDIGFRDAPEAMQSGRSPGRCPDQVVLRGREPVYARNGRCRARPRHGAGGELHLYCIDSELTLQRAVTDVINQRIPIISHSITWLNGGRGDGVNNRDDRVAPDNIAKNAYDHGVLWVNAAGNYAQSHWSGPYTHRPRRVFQDFGGGDETNRFTIPGNDRLCLAHLGRLAQVGPGTRPVCPGGGDGRRRSRRREHPAAGAARRPCGRGVLHEHEFILGARVRVDRGNPARHDEQVRPLVTTGRSSTASRRAASRSRPSRPTCWRSGGLLARRKRVNLRPYSSRGPTIDGRVKPTSSPTTVSPPRRSSCRGTATTAFSGRRRRRRRCGRRRARPPAAAGARRARS